MVGTAIQPERKATQQVPSFLGRYRVIEELGRGGNGVVYRASSPDGAEVAIKTATDVTMSDFAHIRAEIHALRRVRHRAIVRILDDGVQDGCPWFAMERLHGESLFEHIEQGKLELAHRQKKAWTAEALQPVLKLAGGICEPLSELHRTGIVHRDLKPENLFMRDGREPVIVDFGLARQRPLSDTRAVAEEPLIEGTTAYMAPEQFTGELVDARTDLYALGCILFELLVGFTPTFNWGGKVRGVPSRFIDGIPPALDVLLESLLQPRARDRIGHADDVRAWLDAALEHSPRRVMKAEARARLYRPVLSGRDEVVAEVRRAFDQFRHGKGAFVVLQGESGIGKTHIAYEVARRLSDDAHVIVAASQPVEGAIPVPLSCLSRLFELVVREAQQESGSAVRAAILPHLAALTSVHACFAGLGESRSADTAPNPDQVFLALREAVFALAARRPLLLMLDDLQWADELTLRFLASVTEGFLDGNRVLCLATCRSEQTSPRLRELLSLPAVQNILVEPLPRKNLREMTADMLGVAEPPDTIVDFILHYSNGNPYLAAEYLRLVVDEVPLERELALPVVRLLSPEASQLEELPTPGSVRALISRRLERLDSAARRIAELVAVIGGEIESRVFEELSHANAGRDALFELERAQVVEPTPDGGRRLIHDRMRAVIYDGLQMELRKQLHLEAATLLSGTTRSTDDTPHASVAQHFLQAGVPERALPHLESAAELALSRAAYESASRHFEDALATASDLTRHGANHSLVRRSRWRHGAARAHFGNGDMAACERQIKDALGLLGRELPAGRIGWSALALREVLRRGSLTRPRRTRDESSRAVMEVALATGILPYRYFYEEDLLRLVGSAMLSANLARQAREDGVAPGPESLLGAVAGLFRLRTVADRCFASASQGALANGDTREAALALSMESMYHGGFARWEPAESAARRAALVSEHLADPWLRGNIETVLSHIEFFTGRWNGARRRACIIEQLGSRQQTRQQQVWGLYLQARCDIALKRWDDASALLGEAIERLALRPEPVSEIACTGMMAHVASMRGDHERARALTRNVVVEARRRLPPAYPCLVGYASAMQVLVDWIEHEPGHENALLACSMLRSLWRFATVFPMALPTALLNTARLLRLSGARWTSHRLFVWASKDALGRGMPGEAIQALRGAAVTCDDPLRSRTFHEQAELTMASRGASDAEP